MYMIICNWVLYALIVLACFPAVKFLEIYKEAQNSKDSRHVKEMEQASALTENRSPGTDRLS
jgi:hypothetical protein